MASKIGFGEKSGMHEIAFERVKKNRGFIVPNVLVG